MRKPRARSGRITLLTIAVFAMAVLFAARRIIAPGMRYRGANARAQRSETERSDSGENLTPRDDRDLDNLIRERSR